jgi:hypothetical protein
VKEHNCEGADGALSTWRKKLLAGRKSDCMHDMRAGNGSGELTTSNAWLWV